MNDWAIFLIWYFGSTWLVVYIFNLAESGTRNPLRSLPQGILLGFTPFLGQIAAFGIWLYPFVLAIEALIEWADGLPRGKRP